MSVKKYSLGLDSSTQSLTAVVVDMGSGSVVFEKGLDYAKDDRLNGYGIRRGEYTVPPREPGEADQPPLMYLASLDAMFSDMKAAGVDMGSIAVINDSGQQHGHVYLNDRAGDAFAALRAEGAGGSVLTSLLGGIFSYGTAPIWKTSNTAAQAEDIRRGVGGKARMIELSGSDSPLRFTGAVIRRVGQQFPVLYERTARVQLISSFIPAVLAADPDVPWDFGNGCGTSLMDYRKREWSPELLSSAAAGLPGGREGLARKLPELAPPDSCVGTVARYFVEKYSFNPSCRVAAGSGDNPQTKVLISGDLLSLGTSFVNMVSTDGKTLDPDGYANGMYDGVGRPFMFGCRTNGSMVWDGVRALHGLSKDDYKPADGSLASTPAGGSLFFWQPDGESFPSSPAFPVTRIGYTKPDLKEDYSGIIDSTLGLVYRYSRGFARVTAEPLYVTGGVTKVREIMLRTAAIWNRPVITIGTVGAALGAAVAGASAYRKAVGEEPAIEDLSRAVLPGSEPIAPREADVKAYHGEGGYLERMEREFSKIIG